MVGRNGLLLILVVAALLAVGEVHGRRRGSRARKGEYREKKRELIS